MFNKFSISVILHKCSWNKLLFLCCWRFFVSSHTHISYIRIFAKCTNKIISNLHILHWYQFYLPFFGVNLLDFAVFLPFAACCGSVCSAAASGNSYGCRSRKFSDIFFKLTLLLLPIFSVQCSPICLISAPSNFASNFFCSSANSSIEQASGPSRSAVAKNRPISRFNLAFFGFCAKYLQRSMSNAEKSNVRWDNWRAPAYTIRSVPFDDIIFSANSAQFGESHTLSPSTSDSNDVWLVFKYNSNCLKSSSSNALPLIERWRNEVDFFNVWIMYGISMCDNLWETIIMTHSRYGVWGL